MSFPPHSMLYSVKRCLEYLANSDSDVKDQNDKLTDQNDKLTERVKKLEEN